MRNKFLLISAIVLTLSFGCKNTLDSSQVEFKQKLVVKLLAYNDEILSVHVSKTLAVLDTSTKTEPFVETASVVITDDNGVKKTLPYNLANNRYESNWFPLLGHTYSIHVKVGNDEASSSFTIPNPNIGTKAKWQDNTGIDSSGYPTGTISFSINDNGSEHNYYEIALFRYQDVTQTFEAMRVIPGNPEIAANGIINKDGALIVDDGGFNGLSKSLNFLTSYGSAGLVDYKYLVVVRNLSQQYYQYFKSLDNYMQQGGVFSEPSAIYSNITNGVGICAGAGTYRDTIR